MLALLFEIVFKPSEVVDAEKTLRDEKTAREYEIH
jgi:hypothetical protein